MVEVGRNPLRCFLLPLSSTGGSGRRSFGCVSLLFPRLGLSNEDDAEALMGSLDEDSGAVPVLGASLPVLRLAFAHRDQICERPLLPRALGELGLARRSSGDLGLPLEALLEAQAWHGRQCTPRRRDPGQTRAGSAQVLGRALTRHVDDAGGRAPGGAGRWGTLGPW